MITIALLIVFCTAFVLDASDDFVMQFRDAASITWILFMIVFTAYTLIDALTENRDV